MEKSLTFRIFINSAVDQKNLKFGMVITGSLVLFKKLFIATAAFLEGVNLLTPAVETVYTFTASQSTCISGLSSLIDQRGN